jgi:hypothetical protein
LETRKQDGNLAEFYIWGMKDLDSLTFSALFKEASLKCFGYPLQNPLTETESKLFYTQVLDQTGLVIGWKSIKNYSIFVLGMESGKPENPSIATLDTLARYLLKAPYTDETQRKRTESHYPYWFRFKEQFLLSAKQAPRSSRRLRKIIFMSGLLVIGVSILLVMLRTKTPPSFSDNFQSLEEDSLRSRGWLVQSRDSLFWNRRGEEPGYLSLFTLIGDTWPDPQEHAVVQNLLLRKIACDCFTAELHFNHFVPTQDWQQAGILLLEDSDFSGKSIRLSIAYNDSFGGYPKPPEIIIQAITSLGKGSPEPEEIAHQPILFLDTLGGNPDLIRNLDYAALKIEKQGKKFRFLYAGGSMKNNAFKEVVVHEFDMQPKFVGIFALKGFVRKSENIPARINLFRLDCDPCDH